MCAKVAWTLTPKAIEAILRPLIHEPIAVLMGNALAGNDFAKDHIRKARWHDSCTDQERLTDAATDATSQLVKVALGVYAGVDIHARSVGERRL